MAGRRICVIGVGNEQRGDDGVGVWVVRQIQSEAWLGVAAVTLGARDGTALLSVWEGAEKVYVIDAASSEMPVGTIVRIGIGRDDQTPASGQVSSHGVSVPEAVALGRTLDLLPRRLIIYGVVGCRFDFGCGLTPEVARAARTLVHRLRRAVDRLALHHA